MSITEIDITVNLAPLIEEQQYSMFFPSIDYIETIEKIIDVLSIDTEILCDPFLGLGTTFIAGLRKNCFISFFGSDINRSFIEMSKTRFSKWLKLLGYKYLLVQLSKPYGYSFSFGTSKTAQIFCMDGFLLLEKIKGENTIIITSPPSFGCCHNSDKRDLGCLRNYHSYLKALKKLVLLSGNIIVFLRSITIKGKKYNIPADFSLIMRPDIIIRVREKKRNHYAFVYFLR